MIRRLLSTPLFTLATIATLALATGASTAIFSVVHAVLLKPLEYREPEKLVRVSGGATAAKYEAYRRARTLAGVGAYLSITEAASLSGTGAAEPVRGARVSAGFLEVLGLAPQLGRSFLPEEEQPGASVVMIGAQLWRRRFGGNSGIAGSTISISGVPHTIVGVLPDGFAFPFPGVDLWRPFQAATMPVQQRLNSPVLQVFGRLRNGVSLEQASAEMKVIHEAYAAAHPGMLDARRDQAGRVTPLHDELVRDVRRTLWMLSGAVGLLLAIACANIAGLLLARGAARSRELAIRAALGAGRGRILGELLGENAILAVAGGLVGMALASIGVPALASLPGLEPRAHEIHASGAVLVFATLLPAITLLLFGLPPAIAGSRTDLIAAMRPGERRSRALLATPRGLLVAGQVALSMVLVSATALLVMSLIRLSRVDPGFETENVLTMRVGASKPGPEFFAELVRRIEALPGVRSAAVTLTVPMTGFAGIPVHLVGQTPPPLNQRPIAVLQSVTPGYFRTLGIGLKRGRDFTSADRADTAPVAIIDETMARRFWPSYPQGEDPVGHFVLGGASPQPLEIVGVVSAIRQAGLGEKAWLGIYRPRSQTPPYSAMFAVRTVGDPKLLVGPIRREVHALEPDHAIADVKTLGDVVVESESRRRMTSMLLGCFAAAALLLASIGLCAVVAGSAVRRRKEMGIRRALGAGRPHVYGLVMGEGLALVAIGAAAGMAASLAVSRMMESLLFQVSAADPAVLAVVCGIFAAVAGAATFFPARHAARVEPVEVLRAGLF